MSAIRNMTAHLASKDHSVCLNAVINIRNLCTADTPRFAKVLHTADGRKLLSLLVMRIFAVAEISRHVLYIFAKTAEKNDDIILQEPNCLESIMLVASRDKDDNKRSYAHHVLQVLCRRNATPIPDIMILLLDAVKDSCAHVRREVVVTIHAYAESGSEEISLHLKNILRAIGLGNDTQTSLKLHTIMTKSFGMHPRRFIHTEGAMNYVIANLTKVEMIYLLLANADYIPAAFIRDSTLIQQLLAVAKKQHRILIHTFMWFLSMNEAAKNHYQKFADEFLPLDYGDPCMGFQLMILTNCTDAIGDAPLTFLNRNALLYIYTLLKTENSGIREGIYKSLIVMSFNSRIRQMMKSFDHPVADFESPEAFIHARYIAHLTD